MGGRGWWAYFSDGDSHSVPCVSFLIFKDMFLDFRERNGS